MMTHWTYLHLLPGILRDGLLAQKPRLYDNVAGVYLWSDTEGGNRRGSYHATRLMDPAGKPVALQINVEGLTLVVDEADCYDTGDSWICTSDIPADRITVDMESVESEDYAEEVAAIIAG